MRDFACDRCDYRATSRNCLERHVKTVHDRLRDYECPHCDYRAARRYQLDAHVRRRHAVEAEGEDDVEGPGEDGQDMGNDILVFTIMKYI